MPVKISGRLTDGMGKAIPGCVIELKACRTSQTVIKQVVAAQQTENDGVYSFSVGPGQYSVSLLVEGVPPSHAGTITVYEDSQPGTLNDFLGAMTEDDVRPEALRRFELMVEEVARNASAVAQNTAAAKKSASDASTSAREAATHATDAADSARAASTSAGEAATSAQEASSGAETASAKATEAEKSAAAAASSKSAAATSAGAAKTSETNAAASQQSAATSASTATTKASEAATSARDAAASKEAAKSSEVSTANNASAAAASAVAAADSAQKAKDSEVAVAQSASEAENSAKRAEEGADRAVQPVNDALLNTLAGPSLTPEKWNTWPQPVLPVGGMTLAAVNIADAPWGQKLYRGNILPGGVLYAVSLQVENREMALCCTGNNLTTLKGTYRLLGGSMRSGEHKNAANTWFICLVMRVL